MGFLRKGYGASGLRERCNPAPTPRIGTVLVSGLSLLFVLGASLIVTRVASVALEHTGLSRDAARFQARSAFTGAGFTTAEAEQVVGHPVRRRIIMWLMWVGNVGIVSAMAALLLSAIDLRTSQGIGFVLAVLGGGLALLLFLATSRWVDRGVCRVIRWAITHWTQLDAADYVRLLHVREGYVVSRFSISERDWLAGRRLGEVDLAAEGVLVLGVECPGDHFVGAPGADVEIRAGDQLLVYSHASRSGELRGRIAGPAGDRNHVEAQAAQAGRARRERERAGR